MITMDSHLSAYRLLPRAMRPNGFQHGLGILVFLVWPTLMGPALGQENISSSNVQNGAPSPTENLKTLEKQLADQTAAEARLREDAKQRAREIEALRINLIETANSIQDSEREIARIERELIRLEKEELEANTQLAAERENLSEILAAIQAFELSQPPALLVSPEDANRAARAALLLSEATPALARKAETLGAIISRLTEAREGLADQRSAYETTALALTSRRQILSEQLALKEAERDVAERLAAAAQKQTAALAAKATSLKDVVARLQRVAHSVTPRLKPPKPAEKTANIAAKESGEEERKGIEIIVGSASETKKQQALASLNRGSIRAERPQAPFQPTTSFARARGALRYPVVGNLIGSFGQVLDTGERLDGIRIVARDQAIVTAPFEARVQFAQDWGLAGNMIVLDVGGGYYILLIGVGEFLVEEGQRVNAGEPLASMLGAATELELQVRKNGEPVNPGQWFQDANVSTVSL